MIIRHKGELVEGRRKGQREGERGKAREGKRKKMEEKKCLVDERKRVGACMCACLIV